MDKREGLEHFVHALDLRQTIVIDTPVRQRDFQEWRENICFFGIFTHVSGKEGAHQHILGYRAVTDREARLWIHLAIIVRIVFRITL